MPTEYKRSYGNGCIYVTYKVKRATTLLKKCDMAVSLVQVSLDRQKVSYCCSTVTNTYYKEMFHSNFI